MLQEPNRLRLDKLADHVAEDRTDSVKPFVCVTDIRQPSFVKENFLNDENCDCL